jgi:hypothetical protein
MYSTGTANYFLLKGENYLQKRRENYFTKKRKKLFFKPLYRVPLHMQYAGSNISITPDLAWKKVALVAMISCLSVMIHLLE